MMAKAETASRAETRIWSVECHTCETSLGLNIDEFRIVSTDQGAEFIRKPVFVCGKCKNECHITLREQ